MGKLFRFMEKCLTPHKIIHIKEKWKEEIYTYIRIIDCLFLYVFFNISRSGFSSKEKCFNKTKWKEKIYIYIRIICSINHRKSKQQKNANLFPLTFLKINRPPWILFETNAVIKILINISLTRELPHVLKTFWAQISYRSRGCID